MVEGETSPSRTRKRPSRKTSKECSVYISTPERVQVERAHRTRNSAWWTSWGCNWLRLILSRLNINAGAGFQKERSRIRRTPMREPEVTCQQRRNPDVAGRNPYDLRALQLAGRIYGRASSGAVISRCNLKGIHVDADQMATTASKSRTPGLGAR